MAYESVTVDIADHVARVTLIGPGKGNAMGPAFWAELPEVFGTLDADPEVRAIVLTGSGRNFSYGLDLAAMGATLPGLDARRQGPRRTSTPRCAKMQGAITAVADCRTPTIASIHGWCIGGGVDLISAVDIRYASADAKFSVREVKLAIVADVGSLARLPLILSDGHLRELALTGKDIDAARAEKIGLVNDVYADADASLAAAHATAAEIAANPPLTVHGVKDVLDQQRIGRVSESLRYVAAWNSAFLPSKDLAEAVTAMFQKRPPQFTGRVAPLFGRPVSPAPPSVAPAADRDRNVIGPLSSNRSDTLPAIPPCTASSPIRSSLSCGLPSVKSRSARSTHTMLGRVVDS